MSAPIVVSLVTTFVFLPVQIPLTTIFTPPATCLAPTYTISPAGYDFYNATNSAAIRGTDPRCFPVGFVATSAVTVPTAATTTIIANASGSTYLSPPGTPAPSGSATVVGSSKPSTSTITSTVSSTVTQVTFSGTGCPASYTVAASNSTQVGGQNVALITCCPSSLSPSVPATSLSHLLPAVSCVALRQAVSVTGSNALSSSVSVATIWAPAVLMLSPVTSTTTTSSGTSSSTSPTGTSQPGTSGLSTGAKAGIGVGAGLGGLALIAGIFAFFFLRRRRRRQQKSLTGPENSHSDESSRYEKAELPDSSRALGEMSAAAKFAGSGGPNGGIGIDGISEIQSKPVEPNELPGRPVLPTELASAAVARDRLEANHAGPQELPTTEFRAELEGDTDVKKEEMENHV